MPELPEGEEGGITQGVREGEKGTPEEGTPEEGRCREMPQSTA